jgi:ATP-dependent RNA helicase DDX56/DBP9
LRHDTTIHPSRVQQHMKHIPSYLMPKIAPPSNTNATQDDNEDSSKLGYIPYRKNSQHNRHQSKSFKNHPFTHKVFHIFILFTI